MFPPGERRRHNGWEGRRQDRPWVEGLKGKVVNVGVMGTEVLNFKGGDRGQTGGETR